MEESEYEKMYSLEASYWWFQGRKSIIFSLLRSYSLLQRGNQKRIIDLGCGTGLLLAELNKLVFPIGVDFSMMALSFCLRRGIRNLVCADVSCLPFPDSCFDLVFALDLLEHIEDDANLMREMWRICRPGGVVLLTVPAHQFLWSEHDEALHHYRRYSAKQLRKLIIDSGFTALKFSFCISFMFLPILLFRKLQKLFKSSEKPQTHLIILPKLLNSFLIWFLALEARLIRYIDLPLGVSILSLAKKNITIKEP